MRRASQCPVRAFPFTNASTTRLVMRPNSSPAMRGGPCAADRNGTLVPLPRSDTVARRSEEEVRERNCAYPSFALGSRHR